MRVTAQKGNAVQQPGTHMVGGICWQACCSCWKNEATCSADIFSSPATTESHCSSPYHRAPLPG